MLKMHCGRSNPDDALLAIANTPSPELLSAASGNRRCGMAIVLTILAFNLTCPLLNGAEDQQESVIQECLMYIDIVATASHVDASLVEKLLRGLKDDRQTMLDVLDRSIEQRGGSAIGRWRTSKFPRFAGVRVSVAFVAAEQLASLGTRGQSAFEPLIKKASVGDDVFASGFLFAASSVASENCHVDAVRLVPFLRASNTATRMQAALLLSHVEGTESVESALSLAIEDKSARVRSAVLCAVVLRPEWAQLHPSIIPKVAGLLRDRDRFVRLAAYDCLTVWKQTRVASVVLGGRPPSSISEDHCSELVLWGFSDYKDATATLSAGLDECDPLTRRSCAWSLGVLGLHALEYVEKLRSAATQDTNEDVRNAAAEALHRIRKAPPPDEKSAPLPPL
jgi:HEAT repeat protein